jgi:hypothetical protein
MHDNLFYFDLEDFEHVYILGYFWADCYFRKNKRGRSEFSFEVKTSDFLMVWDILQKIGFEKFSTRKRKNSINTQSCVRASKPKNMHFFEQNGFLSRSTDCPLFFHLSREMQKYFIKGFLDGDGSVSLDKNNLFRVGFNGPKDQNWAFLEYYCKSNNINYVIYRKDRPSRHSSHTKKIHQYSVFEFTNAQDRVNLCKSLEFISTGLTRKLDIYKKFKTARLLAGTSKYGKEIVF